MEQMFIKAARQKIRFSTARGNLTVEDLFDLPLTSNTGKANLDDIAKGLHRLLKEDTEISFVNQTKPEDSINTLSFEIVKYVIGVKLEERRAAYLDAEKSATRQRIMAMIEQKKDAALGEKSVDDLEALLKSL